MARNRMKKNPSISNWWTKAANNIKRRCICHQSISWDASIRWLQSNNTAKWCWLPYTSTSIASQWHDTLPSRNSSRRASWWSTWHPGHIPWICSHLTNEHMHHLSKPTPVTNWATHPKLLETLVQSGQLLINIYINCRFLNGLIFL